MSCGNANIKRGSKGPDKNKSYKLGRTVRLKTQRASKN